MSEKRAAGDLANIDEIISGRAQGWRAIYANLGQKHQTSFHRLPLPIVDEGGGADYEIALISPEGRVYDGTGQAHESLKH